MGRDDWRGCAFRECVRLQRDGAWMALDDPIYRLCGSRFSDYEFLYIVGTWVSSMFVFYLRLFLLICVKLLVQNTHE